MYKVKHLRTTVRATGIYMPKNAVNLAAAGLQWCKKDGSNQDNEGLTQTGSNQKNGKKHYLTFDLQNDEKQMIQFHTPTSNPNYQSENIALQDKLKISMILHQKIFGYTYLL